jgi:hypothetical protein
VIFDTDRLLASSLYMNPPMLFNFDRLRFYPRVGTVRKLRPLSSLNYAQHHRIHGRRSLLPDSLFKQCRPNTLKYHTVARLMTINRGSFALLCTLGSSAISITACQIPQSLNTTAHHPTCSLTHAQSKSLPP